MGGQRTMIKFQNEIGVKAVYNQGITRNAKECPWGGILCWWWVRGWWGEKDKENKQPFVSKVYYIYYQLIFKLRWIGQMEPNNRDGIDADLGHLGLKHMLTMGCRACQCWRHIPIYSYSLAVVLFTFFSSNWIAFWIGHYEIHSVQSKMQLDVTETVLTIAVRPEWAKILVHIIIQGLVNILVSLHTVDSTDAPIIVLYESLWSPAHNWTNCADTDMNNARYTVNDF